MKQLTFFLCLLLFLSTVISAQNVVSLNVTQPPEFGFEIGLTDTTIVRGDSITLGQDLTVFGGSGEYIFNWSTEESLSDPTIKNPLAFPEESTTYFLTVMDAYGCSFSVDYTVKVQMYPTAIKNDIKDNQTLFATLFPNPNGGKFKIQLSGEPRDRIELTIIDYSGRILKQQEINNFNGEYTEELDINLSGGAYTLLITTEDQKIQRQFIIN